MINTLTEISHFAELNSREKVLEPGSPAWKASMPTVPTHARCFYVNFLVYHDRHTWIIVEIYVNDNTGNKGYKIIDEYR